jgi:hypothetical protein
MQVATLMVLRTLGLLCYTTSSQSSRKPSLRAICGNRLRQGRRNASNPRCACAVAVGCGLGRRFCGTGQRHGRRHSRNSWDADPPFGGSMLRKDGQLRRGALAADDLDAFIARRPANCVPLNLDPHARTVATCSVGGADLGDGSCATALRWTGLNAPKASMVRPRAPIDALPRTNHTHGGGSRMRRSESAAFRSLAR